MSRARNAWQQLTLAMRDTVPECLGLDLCLDYADLERPKAGIWAGKRHRAYYTKKEAS